MPDESTGTLTQSAGSWTSTEALLKIGIGLLAGAVSAYVVFKILSTGDEPPIRVKGGSVHVEILTADNEQWVDEDDTNPNPANKKKNFHIDRGSRRNDKLQIILVKKGGTACAQTYFPNANSASVNFTDTSPGEIEITSAGKKVKVKSKKGHQLNASGHELSYGTSGDGIRVTSVSVDGVVCDFSDGGTLEGLFVFSW